MRWITVGVLAPTLFAMAYAGPENIQATAAAARLPKRWQMLLSDSPSAQFNEFDSQVHAD